MRTIFHKYFIPHHTNEYKPHFLRAKSINFVVFLVVVVFAGSFTMKSMADTSGLVELILPDTLVQLTNEDRLANGLSTLATNQKLIEAAGYKATDMSSNGYFAHTSPQGVTPWFWFQKVGYTFLKAGENLAINFSASHDVETAWMNSPGHRANILGPSYKEIGISTAQGIYNGNQTIFVVQLFGTPAQFVVPKPDTVASVVEPNTKTPVTKPGMDAVPPPGVVQGETKVLQPQNKKVEIVNKENTTPAAVQFEAHDEHLVPTTVAPPTPQTRVSWFDKFFLDPSRLMKEVYLALAGLILLAILLHLFIEIEHQHIPSLASGVAVLVLMAGLYAVFVNVFGATFVFV